MWDYVLHDWLHGPKSSHKSRRILGPMESRWKRHQEQSA